MTRLLALLLALFALTLPARAADDISAASRSVVRVVTVAMVDGEVVGFGHGSGIAITPTRILTNRSEEHTSELQSLMRISSAVSCLTTKKYTNTNNIST